MNTISVGINLPVAGSRQDYLHCVSSALTAAQVRGDTVAAHSLAGLLTLVDEALSRSQGEAPHFFFSGLGPNSVAPAETGGAEATDIMQRFFERSQNEPELTATQAEATELSQALTVNSPTPLAAMKMRLQMESGGTTLFGKPFRVLS